MNKEELIKLLASIMRDFYGQYKTVGEDAGFRCFYQYIIDEDKKLSKLK